MENGKFGEIKRKLSHKDSISTGISVPSGYSGRGESVPRRDVCATPRKGVAVRRSPRQGLKHIYARGFSGSCRDVARNVSTGVHEILRLYSSAQLVRKARRHGAGQWAGDAGPPKSNRIKFLFMFAARFDYEKFH